MRPGSSPTHVRPDATHSAAHTPQPSKTGHQRPQHYVRGTNYHVPSYRHVRDHRYARPHHTHVHYRHPHAHFNVPSRWHYRGYYSRWWVHPWYRWRYSGVAVVRFTFVTSPWVVTWAPPPRVGFIWVPGYYSYNSWQPGTWEPEVLEDAAPEGYVWVPGWWEGDVYIEGYWRLEYRTDGDWEWVEGFYYDDNSYARAHWRPLGPAPQGYVWEPGFWDGESLIDGFWRPQARRDYDWVPAYYDEEGLINTGYWYPKLEEPGQVWIPGWFDGNEWSEGYWVDEREYRDADIEGWQPEEGWNAGWEDSEPPADVLEPDAPLAVPLDYPQ